MPPFPRLALCALIALPLSACGSSDNSSGGSSSGGDVAAKSAKQVLTDVQAALAKVRSYHLAGSTTDKDGRTQLDGDVTATGSVRFHIHQGAKDAQMILSGSETYLRASRPFWASQGIPAKALKVLVDRWVKVPGSGASGPREMLAEFMPSNLAHCLGAETGTVTKGGTRRFAGQEVVVLADKGDKPGTNPGLLYVATSGPPLPLRVTQTGRQRPGGRQEARCGGSDTSTTAADIRLTNFDKPVKIAPPPGALDLQKLAAGGGTASA